MDKSLILKYIKFSLSIGADNITDPSLESLTDEQLMDSLTHQCFKIGEDPNNISEDRIAELTCLVRKDVYWRMATINAPLYELQMDGLKVAKHTRFEHYLQLIQEIDKEYQALKNDPSRVKIQQGNLFVNRYYNKRIQFNSFKVPEVLIAVDDVLENGYNLSIDLSKVKPEDYVQTLIYFSETPIVDKYENNRISEKAKIVFNSSNYHNTFLRIKDINVLTTNYILLVVKLKNGLKALHELEVIPNELQSHSN